MNRNEDIEAVLKMRSVAVLGCSPNPSRPSHQVAAYLLDAGYRVIPVRPGTAEILGEKCYAGLREIPEPVDVVDVFRRSEFALAAAQDAVAIGAKALWLQDGVESPLAERLARDGGLRVVSNDCLMRQHLSRFGR